MVLIEHYDEDLDLTFEIPQIKMKSGYSVEEVITQNEEIYYAAVLSALHSAITMDLPHVPLLAIEGEEDILVLEKGKEDYREKLGDSLVYFQFKEEYEICTVLAELAKELENDKKDN